MSGYLFQRRGVWYVKTQGENRIEKSLYTSDRAEAKVRAAPFIQAHLRELAARRPRVESSWVPRYTPGLHDAPDGGHIAATAQELSFYDAAGKLLRTESNGSLGYQITGNGRLSAREEFTALDMAWDKGTTGTVRPFVGKAADNAILDSYLDFKGVTGYPRREAESTWATFRELTKGKALARCGWEDGRTLVAHYAGIGLKTASIRKRLVRLNAAVRFAVKTGKLPRDVVNPFAAVVEKVGKDSIRKVALDDADLKACRDNLGSLKASDQLLFRVLCTTGMRLGEAFQITSEQTLKGIRFCEVGTKTESSWRRIPFPVSLLPHLPSAIDGPLFTGTTNDASKRLNNFLRACGITDKAKTAHSLRHRAIELLREANCPDNVSRRLFGHAKDEHEKYGDAIVILKEWVDKIDGI